MSTSFASITEIAALLLALLLLLAVVALGGAAARARRPGSGGADEDGSGGGNQPRVDPPHRPAGTGEPPWWPQFERDLAEYAERARARPSSGG